MKKTVSMDPDKRTWCPSPLAGQITFVTTLNDDGTSNIAPKSWITNIAFDPPMLVVGCNLQHWTAKNILARKEFVVNVPGAEQADRAWHCSAMPHPRSVEAVGFTSMPSTVVKPPRVGECRAHLECVLDRHVAYGQEVVLLAKIAAVTVDEDVVAADDPYELMRMFVYLDGSRYGVIERSHHTEEQ